MRALVQDTFGDPTEVLTVREVDLPEPGPGQVRIRTLFSTIHNHDVGTAKGQYGFKPELPAGAGSEASGVIDALGDGVSGFEVGQRVNAGSAFGTWAEYFVTDADGLLAVPDDISDEAAAQLFAMPFSAVTLLEFLDVKPGQWILQNAANGMVGRLLAQLATARGINVTGLVRRSSAVDDLAEFGIDNVLSTDSEGWRDRAAELAGDAGYIAAVDSVGGESTGDLTRLLGQDGTLVSFGAMSSAGSQGPVNLEIPVTDVLFRELTIKGFWGRRVSNEMSPDKRDELLKEVITGVSAGKLALPVDAVFPLEDVADAIAAGRKSGRSGKVLFRP